MIRNIFNLYGKYVLHPYKSLNSKHLNSKSFNSATAINLMR